MEGVIRSTVETACVQCSVLLGFQMCAAQCCWSLCQGFLALEPWKIHITAAGFPHLYEWNVFCWKQGFSELLQVSLSLFTHRFVLRHLRYPVVFQHSRLYSEMEFMFSLPWSWQHNTQLLAFPGLPYQTDSGVNLPNSVLVNKQSALYCCFCSDS